MNAAGRCEMDMHLLDELACKDCRSYREVRRAWMRGVYRVGHGGATPRPA
jgi:hypothetical protein